MQTEEGFDAVATPWKHMPLGRVDAVLISNHHCASALPLLSQHADFRGPVYMTEAVAQAVQASRALPHSDLVFIFFPFRAAVIRRYHCCE